MAKHHTYSIELGQNYPHDFTMSPKHKRDSVSSACIPARCSFFSYVFRSTADNGYSLVAPASSALYLSVGGREHIGAVMQEDQLLSGSIADNICCLDSSFDEQRMIECARIAGVHDEITAMPMTYNSLIGDMGSSLSSGQKQRVLLARALYRQPKILFLDEGTAHLDIEKEREINAKLRLLPMTRISVAHRPEMMSGADRVLRIDSKAGTMPPEHIAAPA